MPDDGTETPHDSRGRSAGARISEDVAAYTEVTTDFYRGEIDRMTTWRGRLDQTTNWAVVLVAAILTWAFTSADNPHYVILIGVFGVTTFLVMEAHRYREYDVWRDRVRTLQADLFADVYATGDGQDRDWEGELSEELRTPRLKMSLVHAMNHRLRRSYLALLLILLVAWVARITVFQPDEGWRETASILVISGEVVVGAVAVVYAVLVGVALWSARDDRTQEFQT